MHAALGASGADTPRITGKNKPRRSSKLISRALICYTGREKQTKATERTQGFGISTAQTRGEHVGGGGKGGIHSGGGEVELLTSTRRRDEITLRAATAMDLDSTPRTTPRAAEEPAPRRRAGGHLDRPTDRLAGAGGGSGPTRTAGRRIRQQREGGWPRRAPGRSGVRATAAWTRGRLGLDSGRKEASGWGCVRWCWSGGEEI
jgi:hypothetical protein